MQKLDSHQHFWDLNKLEYPWMSPDLAVLNRNFYPSDLKPELDSCGINGTIVVQATHSEAETEWLMDLARKNSFIKGVVGWVDLEAPDIGERIERLQARGPLCGLRHQVHDEPDSSWLLRPEVIRGLRQVAKKGLVFDLLVRPVHLEYLPELLEAVPEMRWVVDHIAKPEIKEGRKEPWWHDLKAVAAFPNISCKVSGMITEADLKNWKPQQIKPYFERVLELFGPERLLFGSDWPVCLLAGSYADVYHLAAEFVKTLSKNEQELFWGGTAARVYRLQN